jgi:hypothetical protein
VLYYLLKKAREISGQVISRHRMRHEPPTGAGLAQGGQPKHMKRFSPEQKFQNSIAFFSRQVRIPLQKISEPGDQEYLLENRLPRTFTPRGTGVISQSL